MNAVVLYVELIIGAIIITVLVGLDSRATVIVALLSIGVTAFIVIVALLSIGVTAFTVTVVIHGVGLITAVFFFFVFFGVPGIIIFSAALFITRIIRAALIGGALLFFIAPVFS